MSERYLVAIVIFLALQLFFNFATMVAVVSIDTKLSRKGDKL